PDAALIADHLPSRDVVDVLGKALTIHSSPFHRPCPRGPSSCPCACGACSQRPAPRLLSQGTWLSLRCRSGGSCPPWERARACSRSAQGTSPTHPAAQSPTGRYPLPWSPCRRLSWSTWPRSPC